MTATEGKTEPPKTEPPKTESPPSNQEAAAPEEKENQNTPNPPPPPKPALKYKTWVLKVSVHCEGCKSKVKKILNNIDGVYMADVDRRQQKVTVIGNVDGEMLIRKLLKTGKQAELWPDSNPDDQGIEVFAWRVKGLPLRGRVRKRRPEREVMVEFRWPTTILAF